MTTKILWVLVSCLMVLSLVLPSCKAATPDKEEGATVTGKVTETEVAKEAEAEEVEEPTVTTKEGPQYGGTLTRSSFPYKAEPRCDPWFGTDMPFLSLVLEPLAMPDYGIPREEFSFKSGFLPLSMVKGGLAESWSQPDLLTYIFNIRKGVHWHNKPPMNGRELDAYDVEYTWHRMFGIPDKYGFTDPHLQNDFFGVDQESVTATDKWTVVVKAKSFSFSTLRFLLLGVLSFIQPREVIEEYGDLMEWENLVGTGPYELTEAIEGSSMTLTKNRDYWGYDENYPENRLPYLDEIRILEMTDISTRLAALRTGKIAFLAERQMTTEMAEGLQQTTELIMLTNISPTQHICMKVDEPPYTDINVRIAMQKALDLETISETYYKGYADATPMGAAGPALAGFSLPYAEWTEEQKYGFIYDPEEAERLLAEAGYPNGFKTKYDICEAWGMDVDLAQILKVYWAEVGVDVELNVLESGLMAERAKAQNHSYEGMSTDEGFGLEWDFPTVTMRTFYYSGVGWNIAGVNDPTFDALLDKAASATNMEDFKQWSIDADMHHVEQHWAIMLPHKRSFLFYQPWLKGYQDEGGPILARCWIDQALKTQMGQ